MHLMLATTNKKKRQELQEILSGLPITFHTLDELKKVPRIVENGKSFQENAVKKAKGYARASGMLTLGEDSGLCVDALEGAPGIYSARFAGRAKDDAKNNAKLLRLLKDVKAKDRKAHYVCAVALADTQGLVGVVEGACHGRIAEAPQGEQGFGYDPIFSIPKFGKTFGQLGERIKHTMSHRYRALRKARPLIQKYIENSKRG
jgi:XTP/dITP diphosphohydrolase